MASNFNAYENYDPGKVYWHMTFKYDLDVGTRA